MNQKKDNNTIFYRFESEYLPIQTLKLKIEINCREHFSVLGLNKKRFEVKSSWFEGGCNLTTYKLEELLGTKLRALYQRRKGRDLYDLWKAMTSVQVNADIIVECYTEYMKFSLDKRIPTKKEFLLNIEKKKNDAEFLGDTFALLRPDEMYDQVEAFQIISQQLVERM